ncbi:MAG: LUD domain-containing protein [Roseobacter sp.]|jgi:L-lactate dehydrogenase complex protein LldG
MSRDAILAKIDRANAGRAAPDIESAAGALIADPDAYRATFAPQPIYDRFVAKATSETVTATVEDLATLSELPDAVAAYMRERDLAPRVALQPRDSLTALDWSDFETVDTAQMNEPLAVTFADAGIAETGSLVFRTGPDAPVLLNFLPLHHLVVLRRGTILPHMEDVFDRFGTTAEAQGRSLNIITGTSGTADIEAKNVRGAHGPRFMHIFCVEEQ